LYELILIYTTMALMTNFYIKLETLETIVKTVKAKGEAGIGLTLSVNDTCNEYGQNVSGWVGQSKDDRDAKKPRYFVGNGGVFWTDGKPPVIAKKPEQAETVKAEVVSDDLPF
jgi:hypothetical protein